MLKYECLYTSVLLILGLAIRVSISSALAKSEQRERIGFSRHGGRKPNPVAPAKHKHNKLSLLNRGFLFTLAHILQRCNNQLRRNTMTEVSNSITEHEGINARAAEAAEKLERLAEEVLLLVRSADEQTSMRLENAIAAVARAGLSIKRSQNIDYGND